MNYAEALSLPNSDTPSFRTTASLSVPAATLKRRASPSFEEQEGDNSRKRMKEDHTGESAGSLAVQLAGMATLDTTGLADDLAQELQCGCCSELVYRPVLVAPCQHFFCGRYASYETALDDYRTLYHTAVAYSGYV